MRKLIDGLNTRDARHILFVDENDFDSVVFDSEDLKITFENIVIEFENASGSTHYVNHLRDQDYKLFKILQKNALITAYEALRIGNIEICQNLIDEFKFKIKPEFKEIERKIKLINNYFKINNEVEVKEESTLNWYDSIAYIEDNSSIKVDDDCTVLRYLAYYNRVKQIIEAKNKNRNGKES